MSILAAHASLAPLCIGIVELLAGTYFWFRRNETARRYKSSEQAARWVAGGSMLLLFLGALSIFTFVHEL